MAQSDANNDGLDAAWASWRVNQAAKAKLAADQAAQQAAAAAAAKSTPQLPTAVPPAGNPFGLAAGTNPGGYIDPNAAKKPPRPPSKRPDLDRMIPDAARYGPGPTTKGQVAGTLVGMAAAPLMPASLLGSIAAGALAGGTQGGIDNPDRLSGVLKGGTQGAIGGAALGLPAAIMSGKGVPLPTGSLGKLQALLKLMVGGAPNLPVTPTTPPEQPPTQIQKPGAIQFDRWGNVSGNRPPGPAPAPPKGQTFGPAPYEGSRFSTEGERPLLGPDRGVKPQRKSPTPKAAAPAAPVPLPPLTTPSDTFRSGAPIKLQSLEDIVSQLKNGPKKPTN